MHLGEDEEVVRLVGVASEHKDERDQRNGEAAVASAVASSPRP